MKTLLETSKFEVITDEKLHYSSNKSGTPILVVVGFVIYNNNPIPSKIYSLDITQYERCDVRLWYQKLLLMIIEQEALKV